VTWAKLPCDGRGDPPEHLVATKMSKLIVHALEVVDIQQDQYRRVCRSRLDPLEFLAELMRSFRIELMSTRPVLPVAVVTTQPDHAPQFRLQLR
jgi:hypothetical protein